MSLKQKSDSRSPVSSDFIENHGSPWIGKILADRKNKFLSGIFYRFAFFVLSHPAPLRFLRATFALLRKYSPVHNIGPFAVLTRHEDVREVLSRMEDFSSANSMNLKTPAGPFVLSIDWRIQHDRELKVLKDASMKFATKDALRISKLAAECANKNINRALKNSPGREVKLNIAADYTENVALHVVENFIGVKALEGQAGRENLRKWLRILAAQIFTPPPIGSKVQADTAEATSGLISYLHRVIATLERTGDPKVEDTLLQRLVRIVEKKKKKYPWLNDDWVCSLVAGMMVAGNATVTRAQTQAIYRLMTLSDAKPAALSTSKMYLENPNVDNRTRVLQVVYEALRFNPMLPVLSPRLCVRNSIVAPGSDHATHIEAGTSVLPFVLAAMFDPKVFPDPNNFKTGRPLENYLHFGWGPHMCFGKFVAEIQFVENCAALFGNPKFEVERSRPAAIVYQGPATINYPLLLKPKVAAKTVRGIS